jgi:hypothetical protein
MKSDVPSTAQHDLFLPRCLDERVHVVEILLERPPPGRACRSRETEPDSFVALAFIVIAL